MMWALTLKLNKACILIFFITFYLANFTENKQVK